MKITLSIVLMIIAFVFAVISFGMHLNKGFDAYIWQLITMIWIANYFVMYLRVERLLRIIKKMTS